MLHFKIEPKWMVTFLVQHSSQRYCRRFFFSLFLFSLRVCRSKTITKRDRVFLTQSICDFSHTAHIHFDLFSILSSDFLSNFQDHNSYGIFIYFIRFFFSLGGLKIRAKWKSAPSKSAHIQKLLCWIKPKPFL